MTDTMTSSYDYIVIGAGSAGAVVASRLSEDRAVRVLLVEAGGRGRDLNVKIPAAFAKQFKTKLDWDYRTEPEPGLNGRRIYHPRGRMLGGCSGQNAMIYIRGHRSIYDGWAAAGATGWSYDDVLPYFRKSERNSRGASEFHGGDGPQHIEDPRSPNPLSRRLVEAIIESGIAANDDFNGAQQEGAGLYQVTQHRGLRWTTNDGYLAPARKRPNLTVLTDTYVTRVVIENGTARGVEAVVAGRRQVLYADREVVLSAGAFATPHLLMLSGIGPAAHLREHGIGIVVDNANVGSHLMDHPFYTLNWETTARGTLAEAESPVQLVNLLTRRRGLLTSNIGEVGAFFSSREGLEAPDLQLIGAPAYFWDNGFATYDRPALALGPSLVGARSTGEVRLASGDPAVKPAVRFNYFSDRADMDAMITGIERTRDMMSGRGIADVVGSEIHPGAAVRSRQEIEQDIRANVAHTYHPSCTARIGTESSGVVDPALRVYGISGLRVADASVYPRIPNGNTHAAAVMVGEKAADLIRDAR